MIDDPIIYFKDSTHSYFDKNGPYTSVSRFSDQFFEKYDSEAGSKRRSFVGYDNRLYLETKDKFGFKWDNPNLLEKMKLKLDEEDLKRIKVLQGIIKKNWTETGQKKSQLGTDKHLYFEHFFEKKKYVKCIFTGDIKYLVIPKPKMDDDFDNRTYIHEFLHLKRNLYFQEVIVYDKKKRVCGTIDKLYLYWTGIEYIAIIGDYKTDAEMEFYSFDRKTSMKDPFSFQNSNYWKYVVKMNIYSFLCNLHGIKVHKMYLYHLSSENSKEQKIYELPFIKPIIQKIFV